MKPKIALVSVLSLASALIVGCSLLGSNASDPGKFDNTLYQTTNVPMITVHSFTNTVTVTNVIPRVETQVVTITNEVGIVVPQTNTVTVFETNRVTETNIVPAGSTVLVPQLVAPSATNQALQSGASGIASMFGFGGIAAALLSGIGNWYQKARNQALAAKYTGASQGQAIASQASAALVQNVETLLEVLNKTPQGQAVLPNIKTFLRTHQLETGTAAIIGQFIDEHVDNEAARNAADELMKGINTLKA